MTPQQRTALEALAGRALTQAEVEQIDVLLDPDNRNDVAIAAVLSLKADGSPRTRTVPTEVGNGTILEVLGFAAGNALLDVINTAPDFRHVKPLVEQGRLRLDSPLTIGALQSLVPAVLTQAQADAMAARASQPDPVSPAAVSAALTALEA